MAPWISRLLETKGLLDGDGVHRSARARYCPTCHQPVMAGLDGDVGGFAVKVDPTPVDAGGELAALMAGRRTYTLAWLANRYELDYRDAGRMQFTPPGTKANHDVVVSHSCNSPINSGFAIPSSINHSTSEGFSNEPTF